MRPNPNPGPRTRYLLLLLLLLLLLRLLTALLSEEALDEVLVGEGHVAVVLQGEG